MLTAAVAATDCGSGGSFLHAYMTGALAEKLDTRAGVTCAGQSNFSVGNPRIECEGFLCMGKGYTPQPVPLTSAPPADDPLRPAPVAHPDARPPDQHRITGHGCRAFPCPCPAFALRTLGSGRDRRDPRGLWFLPRGRKSWIWASPAPLFSFCWAQALVFAEENAKSWIWTSPVPTIYF